MKILRRETEDVMMAAGRTLLHTCCGPCASACVPTLKNLGREVTMLFANSNIDTKEEFEKRLREAEKLALVDGVKIVALPYDHEEWLREVAAGYEHEPEKGARCARCFRYNLTKAAEYAKAHGFDEFTTSLTVSPHKVSRTIFEVALAITANRQSPTANFLPCDFKKNEGFKLSTRRAQELGLYRQSYCGCEFSKWRVHHQAETVSTNLDARAGKHGDVFTAGHQTAGRGRLDHKWLSPPGTNLMMSVVLSVADLAPNHIATLPLVIGLAVAKAIDRTVVVSSTGAVNVGPLDSASRGDRDGTRFYNCQLKWPNDVLVNGKKIAGILCERNGDNVIVGIGVNVGQTEFDREIADRATSLAVVAPALVSRLQSPVLSVRAAVLCEIDRWYSCWREKGFAAVHPEIAAVDLLRGRTVSVRQNDDDSVPLTGVSNGIMGDGALDVGGVKVYAGEAHVEKI